MYTFPIHQSLSSFLLIVLLFFTPASSAPEDYQQFRDCLPTPFDCGDCSPFPYACGNVKLNISYPFWTQGRPDYCGYPEEFVITCNGNDNSSEIEIQSRKYHVMRIDYENQIATIVNKDYYLAKEGIKKGSMSPCLAPSSKTSLDFNLFNYTYGDLNLSFLYDCPDHLAQNGYIYLKLPSCSSDDLSDHAYFTFEENITGSFKNCQVIHIPILHKNKKRLLENPEEFWIDVLAEGFEVTWSFTHFDYLCWDCFKSNGSLCRRNETSRLQRDCYCNGTSHPLMCPLAPAPAPGIGKRKKHTIIGAIIGLILTCCFVFILCLVRKLPSDNSIFFWKKKTSDSRNVEAFLENYGSLAPKRYRYSELKTMTNSFKDNLGHGGYGSVFKGSLKDGRPVAVKVLNNAKGGNGDEFINEVASIGRTCHVNVVTLLGFCSEGTNRALVYEFMSKGSLEKFIFSDHLGNTQHVLNCQKLFQIAVGIARGLEYLHRGCSTRIVHFDIKPHNILLDDDFCPKISDFGLAKLCPQQQSTLSMIDARGTIGYTAPEVFCRSIGGVSHKSDVYSYGMMVLEMIGGRKNIDAEAKKTSEIYFPHWVYKHIELKESLALLGFQSEAEEDIGRQMILVGLWCIQTNPTNRPSMTKVVEMLEARLGSLEMPPKPYLSSP